MIHVKVEKAHAKYKKIAILGHAMYDDYGKDIVCAGVTALMRTLVKSIEDLTEDEIEYEISSGKVDIHYRNLLEKSRTLVDSFFVGVCMIANEYPEYVKII